MQKKVMPLTQISKHWIIMLPSLLIVIYGMASAVAAPPDSPSYTGSNAVFATDANAGVNVEKALPGAAALVDDHIIPMEEVILVCLRKYRSYVIDQIVQGYVVDRECQKRGLTVSESEIDKRIADLGEKLAPATLDETLKKHHTTIAEVRNKFRQDLERTLLVASQVKPVRMIHAREIFVKYAGSGTNLTEAGALAVVKEIQEQFKQGKDFATLAARYSANNGADGKGDLGILYGNMMGVEAALLDAVMALHKGELSPSVKTEDGYRLVQAFNTDDDHSKAEDSLYKAANEASRRLQIQFLEPKTVVELINHSKITFVEDAELVAGKPLPDAAAIIDGHAIPMKEVVAKCLAGYGPKTVDILVQNYVVDRECEQRGIKVSDAEIDRRIADLRKQIAPATLDEGLKMHHTTMDGLKYDFRQQIKRTQLVINQVKPTKLVHARAILVTANPSGNVEPASGAKRTEADAKALLMNIQNQLKAGKSFAELAKRYSEITGTDSDGDMGVLYEGRQGIDTTILNTALAMDKGGITPAPVKTLAGYFLLQIISTDDSHASDEDAAYAQALTTCLEQKAQSLIPQAIVDLIKKSKVIYYVHS